MTQAVTSELHRALANLGLAPNALKELENGLSVARGVASVTGTGTVVTGLKTVVAVFAVMQDDMSINANGVSATIGDQAGSPAAGSVTLKVWAPTSNSDPTPTASSTATKVNWLALGTAF